MTEHRRPSAAVIPLRDEDRVDQQLLDDLDVLRNALCQHLRDELHRKRLRRVRRAPQRTRHR